MMADILIVDDEKDIRALVSGVLRDQGIQTREAWDSTTTYAELFDIDFGARVIDTPGIKGFGIVNFEKNEIGDFFPEFFQNKNKCKFNNCLHIDEPDCFIKELVSSNKINISRYENYKQIIMQDDLKYR